MSRIDRNASRREALTQPLSASSGGSADERCYSDVLAAIRQVASGYRAPLASQVVAECAAAADNAFATSRPALGTGGGWRAVRFTHERTLAPMSHVERPDNEGGWERVTLHIPDAIADQIVLAVNHHDKLVSALRAVTESADAVAFAENIGSLDEVIAAARAVLAEVEKG